MGPGGLSPSSCARSQRCRRVIPAGYRGLSGAGGSPGPPGEQGQPGEPGVLTAAGPVLPGEVEAPQHLHERRVQGGLRGGAGAFPHLQLRLVLGLILILFLPVLESARGPPRAPPPPPREGVGDAPRLLHGPARHGGGTAPPLPGTGRDPPLSGASSRDPPLPTAGRKRRGRAGEPAMGTLGCCHLRPLPPSRWPSSPAPLGTPWLSPGAVTSPCCPCQQPHCHLRGSACHPEGTVPSIPVLPVPLAMSLTSVTVTRGNATS